MPRTQTDIRTWLDDEGVEAEGMLLADGYEDAFIGIASAGPDGKYVAVYDFPECLRILQERDGMTTQAADEYFSFNTLAAHVGPQTPLYLHRMPAVTAVAESGKPLPGFEKVDLTSDDARQGHLF